MKTILLIIMFSIEFCYAQFIPHEAHLTASKDSVLSSEEFTVTYSLTGVEGYIYIGVEDLYFDVIGQDSWEGRMKMDDITNLKFTVKFKEKFKPYLFSNKVPIGIGFSFKPFDKIIGVGIFESIPITILDVEHFKGEKKIPDSSNHNELQNMNLYPVNLNLEINKKTIVPNPNQIKLEFPQSQSIDFFETKGDESAKSVGNHTSDYGKNLMKEIS